MDKNINIITDLDDKKIVLINDVRFKGRRNYDWDDIEIYLKEYISQYFEILENCISNHFYNENIFRIE